MESSQKGKAGLGNPLGNPDWDNFIKESNCRVYYVDREKLRGVNALAKKGRDSANMISSWC